MSKLAVSYRVSNLLSKMSYKTFKQKHDRMLHLLKYLFSEINSMVTSIMTKNVCFSLEDSKEPECDYMKMANVASNCSRLLVETISK